MWRSGIQAVFKWRVSHLGAVRPCLTPWASTSSFGSEVRVPLCGVVLGIRNIMCTAIEWRQEALLWLQKQVQIWNVLLLTPSWSRFENGVETQIHRDFEVIVNCLTKFSLHSHDKRILFWGLDTCGPCLGRYTQSFFTVIWIAGTPSEREVTFYYWSVFYRIVSCYLMILTLESQIS